MKAIASILLALLVVASGCLRSQIIEVEIVNTGSTAVRNLEVQYPGGSYGAPELVPNKPHVYKIKPFSAAPIQITYVDSSGKPQIFTGPRVSKGDHGVITIRISDAGLTWDAKVMH
jgi:hypothetical protein